MTLVLGCHRSGTSALTKALIDLGLESNIQNDDDRTIHNPKGHFELVEIRAFNGRLMAFLGAAWDNWGFHPAQVNWDRRDLDSFKAEAAALIDKNFAGPGEYVFKDPRMMGLMPFWTPIFAGLGISLRVLMIVRDPAEVSASLLARHGHGALFERLDSSDQALALWCVSMHAALTTLPDCDSRIVSHRALMTAPTQTVTALAEWLSLSLDGVQKAASGIDPELYHWPEARLDPGYWGQIAAELYASLPAPIDPLKPIDRAAIAAHLAAHTRIAALVPALGAMCSAIEVRDQQTLAATMPAPLSTPNYNDQAPPQAAVWALSHLIHSGAPPFRLRAALADIEKISFDPDFWLPKRMAAQIHQALGDHDAAIQIFQAFYAAAPRPGRRDLLASALRKAGREDEAQALP